MEFYERFGAKVANCEQMIGYEFTLKETIAEALNASNDTMSNFIQDGHSKCLARNQRLAIYGEATVNHHLCRIWFEAQTSTKGDWNAIRNDILSNTGMGSIGEAIRLDECIIVNLGTRPSTAMTAKALCAVLGAVSVDGGPRALSSVITRLGLTEDKVRSSCRSR